MALSTPLRRISSMYTNHKQLRDGKGNAALQELSKHLSCLALKDSPTHRLDRNPNLAHRILPFCTKGVKMTSICRCYIINQRYRHKDQLSCLALSPYKHTYEHVSSVRTFALFPALGISLSVNMTKSTIKDRDLQYMNRVHIRYNLISLENKRRPQCLCIAL